tara:strand:- start:700 stop:1350 length:651 start_codon:yes stop_codon:yes gene_type:complete
LLYAYSALLVLASASLPRKRLLEQVGISHETIASELDESAFDCTDPIELTNSLAKAKGEAVFEKINNRRNKFPFSHRVEAIISCDSIFEFQGQCLGKPSDQKEAINRLRRMSGKTGYLHTGHCCLYSNDLILDFNTRTKLKFSIENISTKVKFVDFSEDEINRYVETQEPLQSAGGFTLEGKGGLFIEEINGCFSNVLGLSLPWLRKVLIISKFTQ